jgi:uncharacterized protein with PQ loop repeat
MFIVCCICSIVSPNEGNMLHFIIAIFFAQYVLSQVIENFDDRSTIFFITELLNCCSSSIHGCLIENWNTHQYLYSIFEIHF